MEQGHSHNILCADKKDDGFSDKIFEEEALSGGKTYDIMTITDNFPVRRIDRMILEEYTMSKYIVSVVPLGEQEIERIQAVAGDYEILCFKSGAEIGDEILTIGGIYGRVVSIKDDSIIIESSAERNKLRILRSAVSQNLTVHDTPAPAKEEKPKKVKAKKEESEEQK